jgi:gag-polypeptide of LTR copia-type
MLRMNNLERVSDYIIKVQTIINQLKRNEESLLEQRVVEKILRSLIDTLKNMVCVVEESKDLAELSVNELADSLLAYERRKKLKKKTNSREIPPSYCGSRRENAVCAYSTADTQSRRVEPVRAVKPNLTRMREKPIRQKKTRCRLL